MIIEQYAVSTWFRWVDDLEVPAENLFQIFNLRSNKERSKRLGDNTLEAHFAFGGSNAGTVMVNTYTILGHGGKGTSFVSRSIKSPNYIWTFLYLGYSHEINKFYAAVIQPGLAHQISLQRISHKLNNRLHFTIGYDEKVSSFNGRIAYCTLFVGPDSYREGLVFGNSYGFGKGAETLFQLGKPLVITDEVQGEPNRLRELSYDQEEAAFESILVHDDNECKINGQ